MFSSHYFSRFSIKNKINSQRHLVIADPDYNWGVSEKIFGDNRLSPYPDVSNTEFPVGIEKREINESYHEFNQLPATRLEGEKIGNLLESKPYFGKDAVKTLIKNKKPQGIIHIATHGFFLGDLTEDPRKPERRDIGAVSDINSSNQIVRMKHIPNPLLRAGLAFAGVNAWLKDLQPPVEAENGLLTAEEVTGLDLTNIELVVLSACDTGLGEIKSGEGVFGFRRSFIIAGARTLIMSLWEVPDDETQELMTNFYGAIVAGKSRAEALREAQLLVKSKHPEPFYWGAFICQGDPGPLILH
ncbi:MAG: CHAT domain-containing protein [Methanoregulaceae archaeon]